MVKVMRVRGKWMEEREGRRKRGGWRKEGGGRNGGKREGWRRANLKSLVVQVKGVVRFGNHNLDRAGSVWG